MNFEGNGLFVSIDFAQGVGLMLLLWGIWPVFRWFQREWR
jgi:hypothetical protein